MPKLKTYNERMLLMLEYAKQDKLVKNEGEWCKKVKILEQNLSAIKRGERSFTISQIINACKLSKQSSDWVLGISNKEKNGLELIKEGIRLLENKTKK